MDMGFLLGDNEKFMQLHSDNGYTICEYTENTELYVFKCDFHSL